MKKIIFVTCPLLLLINIPLGYMLPAYPLFNMRLVSLTLLVNGVLSYAVCASRIQDAYKVSLSGIFFLMMLLQTGLALACNEEFTDSVAAVCYVLSFVLQIFIGVIVYVTAKKN